MILNTAVLHFDLDDVVSSMQVCTTDTQTTNDNASTGRDANARQCGMNREVWLAVRNMVLFIGPTVTVTNSHASSWNANCIQHERQWDELSVPHEQCWKEYVVVTLITNRGVVELSIMFPHRQDSVHVHM